MRFYIPFILILLFYSTLGVAETKSEIPNFDNWVAGREERWALLNAEQAADLILIVNNTKRSMPWLKFDSLVRLDQGVTSELAKYRGNSMFFPRLTSISKDDAQGFAKWTSYQPFLLLGLTNIDDEVAHELAKFKGRLKFPELDSIKPDAAKELAMFKGKCLEFNSLTNPGKEALSELAKCKSDLILESVTYLDRDDAEALFSKSHGNLTVRLSSIDKHAAQSLANCMSPRINLSGRNYWQPEFGGDGINSLDKDVAEQLVKFKNKLTLKVQSINDVELCRALAKFKGTKLNICSPKPRDERCIAYLNSNSRIQWIDLNSKKSFSDP